VEIDNNCQITWLPSLFHIGPMAELLSSIGLLFLLQCMFLCGQIILEDRRNVEIFERLLLPMVHVLESTQL
jgi:hypothetical protein